jgi:hypothetical protein
MKRGLQSVYLAIVFGVLPTGVPAAQPEGIVSSGRIEAVLANEHRKDLEKIKKEFAETGLTNLHVQFMKVSKPPTNIGLGPSVTAERARAAIRMAKKYNRDVTILLPERLFPDHYVAIASSSFDDSVEYPVSAEQLRELENPALTTEQFHTLYRRLTPADQPPVKKGRVF